MKNTLLGLCGMTFLSLHDVSAQTGVAQAIRLATASFIASQLQELHASAYKDRSPRLLVPIVLPKTVNGLAIERTQVAAPRSAEESAALAAKLGGRVASPEDVIDMVAGQPVGTMGLRIRIGDPKVVGDSAVIMFSLESRGTTGRMLPGFENSYVVVLTRSRGTDWLVQSFGLANQDKVPSVLTPVASSSRGTPPLDDRQ